MSTTRPDEADSQSESDRDATHCAGAPLARMLVLALDGATFDVIHPMVAAGKLPNLARWIAEGVARPLPSTTPPVTFPAWSSFMTGLEPGEHGIFDFTQKVPGAYRIRFVNSSDRAGESLFARVSAAGGRVLVLGMPATYPPEPLNGLLVPGFDAPVSTGSDARATNDPALYERIARRAGPWMRPDLDENARADDFHERAVATLLTRIDRKTAFLISALQEFSRNDQKAPDFLTIVFSESDTVGHHYFRDHDRNSPRHDPGASDARRGAISSVYERLDAACGEIRSAFGEDATCFVVSDHGMGPAGQFVVHLNRYLADQGLLHRRGSAALQRAARRLRDTAVALLPPRLAQQIFRRARASAARLESAVRFGGIDWAKTVAFSEEANTQPGVWINLSGREARGSVAADDYEKVRDRVIDALLEWHLPASDGTSQREPVIASARRREEVYSGPFVDRAPDIVVELGTAGGYGLSLVPTAWEIDDGRPALRELSRDEFAGGRGRGMNGTHRPNGIFIATPGRGRALDAASLPTRLSEVAPAVLAEIGIEPIARGDDDASDPMNPRVDYSDDEDAAVAERLRALGYLE